MNESTEFVAVGMRNCTPLFSEFSRGNEGPMELRGDMIPPSMIDPWASEKVMEGLRVGERLVDSYTRGRLSGESNGAFDRIGRALLRLGGLGKCDSGTPFALASFCSISSSFSSFITTESTSSS